MKCMHCGKELVAMTFYVKQGAFGTAGPVATINQSVYHPLASGETIYYSAANAAAGAYIIPSYSCAHEPTFDVPDTTGGNY